MKKFKYFLFILFTLHLSAFSEEVKLEKILGNGALFCGPSIAGVNFLTAMLKDENGKSQLGKHDPNWMKNYRLVKLDKAQEIRAVTDIQATILNIPVTKLTYTIGFNGNEFSGYKMDLQISRKKLIETLKESSDLRIKNELKNFNSDFWRNFGIDRGEKTILNCTIAG
jgi:hypothetical protein